MFFKSKDAPDSYGEVVQQTAAMVKNRKARGLAKQHGLRILDVTWEDTGRYKGSCVGPNISDMTIQVQDLHPRTGKHRLTCMPVIRTPNFTDVSADVPLESFYLRVGNEKGKGLTKVNLRQVLGNLRDYLTDAGSWAGEGSSLLANRDTHVLASAQACFLPIPKEGSATFNPVLFNYQSMAGDPAVLTMLATREGTSVTVIDNQRDGFTAGATWGQRLFFNQAGQRASLTGERLSDFVAGAESESGDSSHEQPGLNMVLLIQVPLKQAEESLPAYSEFMLGGVSRVRCVAASDVEEAVIGHGEIEGPFTEIDDLPIERDPRFPIRVTVQFYKATSNGVVSAEDMEEIAEQIDRVYREADYVGSLVTEGETPRPTEFDGPKEEPPGWWDDFWARHESNTGQSRQEAIEMLRRIRPHGYPESPAELRQVLEMLGED